MQLLLERNLRPTWAEVDLDAVTHNVRELYRVAEGSQVMAVVKADAYGHGACEVAEAALAGGARWLGVACLEEALQLRRRGFRVPLLVLGYVPPEEARVAVEEEISCCVFGEELARAMAQAAGRVGKMGRVHVKVDTGMGRLGVGADQAVAFVRRLKGIPGLDVEGVFTHLATADEENLSFAEEQLGRFAAVVAELDREGLHVPYRHAANSAALLRLPQSRYNLVRTGLAMYGVHPVPGSVGSAHLRPVLSWKTRVAQVKRMSPGATVGYGRTWKAAGGEVVATLPVGYADGYRRSLSNRGMALLGGRKVRVVGRVSMDQITVLAGSGDTPDGQVAPGQEVVLLGGQEGNSLTAWDLARDMDTIPYEVLVGIGARVPRVYLRDGVVYRIRTPLGGSREVAP